MTDLLTRQQGPSFPPGDGSEVITSTGGAQSPDVLLGIVAGGAIQDALVGEQQASRDHEVFRLTRDPNTYEVTVESDVTLADYEAITHPDDWALLLDWAKPLQDDKTVTYINPTMEGGGVAMMRPPVVHLLKLLGVDAHWFVMEHTEGLPDDQEPFIVTKLMHNVLQRKTDERLTEADIALHWQWADEENGPVLERQEPIRSANFIVIDDPQPAPLINRLRTANPYAKIVWRDHIDTDGKLMADPSTPQGEVAAYLLDVCGVRGVDAVITHPVEEFVHPDMADKTYFSPATLETFDNLNRHLDEAEIVAGIEFINAEIAEKNQELTADGRTDDIQPLLSLDPNRQRITLIARFDPSKGMDKAMKMGVLTRQKMRDAGVPEDQLPEVVIVGNGSVDDPDGPGMFEEMLRERREQYPDEMHGIILMRLKHNYDAMNALMRRSHILMQTSDAEGLETRVSDAIMHGKPVVVSNRGGIKTQVAEGKSGIILDYDKPGHDLERGAEFMSDLLMDPIAYQAMVDSTKEQAVAFNSREFTTTANVARWMRIFKNLQAGEEADRLWKITDFAAATQPRL